MTTAELENDPDTATLLRRYKKRVQLQKRAKARQDEEERARFL